MARDENTPVTGENNNEGFEPPEKHQAVDNAGKLLGNMMSSMNAALGAEDTPVVLDRRRRHVSIKDLEDLIDRALE